MKTRNATSSMVGVGVLTAAAALVAPREARAQQCTRDGLWYCEMNNTTGVVEGQDLGDGVGVNGTSYTGIGTEGISTSGYGGNFTSTGNYGVYGQSTNSYGGYFASTNYTALTGTVTSNSYSGVAGINFGNGYGLYGEAEGSTGGIGTFGEATGNDGYGVYGQVSGGTGATAVYGTASNSGTGVKGSTSGTGSAGVWGTCSGSSCQGVYGACSGSGCSAGYFNGNVYTTGTYNSSDIRLKKNVQPLTGGLDALLQLQGVTFEWNKPEDHANQTGTQRGFIAQDVEKVFPGWIGADKSGYKTVSLQQIEPLEVESIRELKADNDDLRGKVEASQARIARLEERLDALQNGRDPITGGVGVGRGALALLGLGLAGAFGLSKLKRHGA